MRYRACSRPAHPAVADVQQQEHIGANHTDWDSRDENGVAIHNVRGGVWWCGHHLGEQSHTLQLPGVVPARHPVAARQAEGAAPTLLVNPTNAPRPRGHAALAVPRDLGLEVFRLSQGTPSWWDAAARLARLLGLLVPVLAAYGYGYVNMHLSVLGHSGPTTGGGPPDARLQPVRTCPQYVGWAARRRYTSAISAQHVAE